VNFNIIKVLLALIPVLLLNTPLVQAGDEPWYLEADRLEVDQDKNLLEAFGNVHLWRLNDYVQAEYARLYTDTNWVYLRGNIRAEFEGDSITGEEAELDIDSHVGWIKDGQVFMAEHNVYFTGRRLEKTGPHTYTFEQGVMTSCDDRPAPWSIKSSRGEITVEGYARLWHPRFRIKDRPVLYSPYMIAPVKTERQSGFLFPDIGYGSEYGVNVNVPYYWVIDDQRDMTFYANYYSDRGLMAGTEYRHTPGLYSKGLWRADWLRDREIHDEDNVPERLFREYRGQELFRSNRDRYWIRGKYDGYDPATGWTYKADVDLVSDQNYLMEFKSGQSGFYASRDEFESRFGRDIQDRNRLIRTNIFSAARNWGRWGLNARLVYSDHLAYKNDNLPRSKNPTLQRLPETNLDLYRTSLGNSPFELESANQAVYFWRKYGTTAGRVDVHPRLSLPLRAGWGRITPRVGWRQTGYMVDSFQADPAERDTDNRLQTRGIYDFNLSADSELFRIFDMGRPLDPGVDPVGSSAWTGLRHTIVPEVEFDYIPEKDQEKYPQFDSIDRIAPREELTYTLSNYFTRRQERIVEAADDEGPRLRRDYRDFLQLKLEQSYDFREARRRDRLNEYERRPFSDLMAQVRFNPNQYVTLRNKTWYSFYENMITEHEHTLTLTWPDKVSTWFSLDFLDQIDEYKRRIVDKTSIMELGADLDFIRNWHLGLLYRRDLEESVDLKRELRIKYRHQCYSLEFAVRETDYDHSFEIRINLLNLGEWGI